MGQKETFEFINKQKRLLRPLNLSGDVPGDGFGIYNAVGGYKIDIKFISCFLKKCDDVFIKSKNLLNKTNLEKN